MRAFNKYEIFESTCWTEEDKARIQFIYLILLRKQNLLRKLEKEDTQHILVACTSSLRLSFSWVKIPALWYSFEDKLRYLLYTYIELLDRTVFIFYFSNFKSLFNARFPSSLQTCQLRFQVQKLGVNFPTKLDSTFQCLNYCKQMFILQVESNNSTMKWTCELVAKFAPNFQTWKRNWQFRNELGNHALKSDLKSTITDTVTLAYHI